MRDSRIANHPRVKPRNTGHQETIQPMNHPPPNDWMGGLQWKGTFHGPRDRTAKSGWGYGIKEVGIKAAGKKSAKGRQMLRR